MVVLTYGGTRLIDANEIRVIPWVRDVRVGHSGYAPVESFGWTSNITADYHRYAVSATGANRSYSIQLSRMCKTAAEADALLKAFAKSLQPSFFYDEHMERKVNAESTSKAKALSCKTQNEYPLATAADPTKDAILRKDNS